jgi:hypothetical protein
VIAGTIVQNMLTSVARRVALVSVASGLVVAAVAFGSAPVGAVSHPAAAHPNAKITTASLSKVSVAPHSTTAWAFGSQSTAKFVTSYYALRRSGGHLSKEPVKAPASSQFFSLAAGSPKSVWLVGDFVKGTTPETLIEHSTGGGFKRLKTKLGVGQLVSICASSPSNAWAVGDGRTAPGPYIVHWNGKAWKVVRETKQVGVSFNSVSASSPRNVWMLGNGPAGSVAGVWNGHRLSVKPIPVPTGSSLTAIATTSAKSTWVVGTSSVGTTTVHQDTFTEHWNGRKWKVVKAPSPAYYSSPTAVAAAGSRVYLTGTATPKSGLKYGPYILRFAGGKWKKVPSASPGRQSQLTSISVSSKGGTAVGNWSVRGQCVTHPSPVLPLVENLAGSSWHQASAPKFRSGGARLRMDSSAPDIPSC